VAKGTSGEAADEPGRGHALLQRNRGKAGARVRTEAEESLRAKSVYIAKLLGGVALFFGHVFAASPSRSFPHSQNWNSAKLIPLNLATFY